MDGFLPIIHAQIWMLKNYVGKIKEEPRIKVSLILFFVIFFWFSALGIFYKGFGFFNRFPLIGAVLIDETIYLFFAALFVMLTLSSIVVCYVTFYSSKEVDFLFSKPIDTQAIFFYRFIQSVVFSSWAFLFIGMPFIIAYALIKDVSFWFYIMIPFYIIPFLILPTALASLIILFFMRFLDFHKIKYIIALIILMVLGILFWTYRFNIRPSFSSKNEIDFIMNELLYHLRFIRYPLFPGYWMSKAVINTSTNLFRDAFFYFSTFTITTIFIMQIVWVVAGKTFFWGWVNSRGGRKEKFYRIDRGILNYISRCIPLLPRPTLAMVIKDIKVLFRDPGQWSQFLVYFSILGLYIFNLRNVPKEAISIFWEITITFLNLMATILVLASLTVRFLFPLISLEGNKIWVLGLAPVTFRGLIFQKFLINFSGILIISESLMYATNVVLNTSFTLKIVSCGIAAMASFGLVGLSIGLGAIYPHFKEDNTAKIVSGFGGTLNFIIALIYVLILIGAFGLPFYIHRVNVLITGRAFHFLINMAWIITILITIAVGVLPMVIGYRELENMEF